MNTRSVVPVLLLAAAALAACGEKEAAPADSTAAAAAAAPAAPTLADFAGDFSWVMKPEVGDSVLGEGTSHNNPDGTGWAVNAISPKDTTMFTTTIVGDSIIQVSAPYTDAQQPKAGQFVFRYAALANTDALGGMLAISPAAKRDTVVRRARVEVTRR